MNAHLDTGAAVDTFLVNFDREGVGDGSTYHWISGVEACQFPGHDEKCQTLILEWKTRGCTSSVG